MLFACCFPVLYIVLFEELILALRPLTFPSHCCFLLMSVTPGDESLDTPLTSVRLSVLPEFREALDPPGLRRNDRDRCSRRSRRMPLRRNLGTMSGR